MLKLNRRLLIWIIPFLALAGSVILTGFLVRRWIDRHTGIFISELELSINTLETAQADPEAALLQAQTHLAAARTELETLRPVVEPVVIGANKLTEWPGVGTSARQLINLWVFADAITTMSEELVGGSRVGWTNFEANGIEGVSAALPAIQSDLQAVERSLSQAQTARSRLGPADQVNTLIWLSDDQVAKLETVLTRWDIWAPALADTLAEINQLLNQVDLVQVWTDVQTLTYELGQVSAMLETGEEDPFLTSRKTRKHLAAAQAAFESLRPTVGPLIERVDRLSWLLQVTPLPQNDLPPANLAQQMAAWWRFTEAVMLLGRELTAVVELGFLNIDQAGMEGVLAAMPTIQDHLHTAQIYLVQARAARAELEPVNWLPDGIAPSLDDTLMQWDTFAPILEEILPRAEPLARTLPIILGSEGPMTYLLLVQSSDQLRATGGWVGGVGLIEIDHGKITSVTLREIGEFDNYGQRFEISIWPPDPLYHYMGKNHWRLRDANWWADFPASARQAKILWDEENAIHIDGVIAVTDQTVARWLAVMGSVEDFSGQEVNQQNLLEFAANRMYGEASKGVNSQTTLLQEMALIFVSLTQDLSTRKALRMSQFLREAVTHKDFLMTMHDYALAATLNELEIDGAIQGQQDDYFYLVESNVADTKISRLIQQDLKYEVELDATAWPTLAILTVDQINTFTPEDKLFGAPEGNYQGGRWNFETDVFDRWPGYYGGYTRLFPPDDSRFTAVTGFDEGPDIYDENYRTVVGGYVGEHPGNQRQLQFRWIPNGQPSESGRYRLLVQRQPGAPEHTLSVEVKLPVGYQATDVSPPPILLTDESVIWYAILDQNQDFSLRLEDDGSGLANQAESSSTSTDSAASDPISPSIVTSVDAPTAVAQTGPPPVAPAPSPEPGRAPLPVRLSIPAIGVGAPVVSVGLEPSGIMASPSEADIVGWYKLGPRPGEPSNAILAGHVDWKGEVGAFARLHKLKLGDAIEVQSGPKTSYHYVIESIETYQADTAPVDEIFGATPGPVLTLITCGGPYDYLRQEYRDRIVVRARGMD